VTGYVLNATLTGVLSAVFTGVIVRMTNCDCWTDSGTPPIEWVCVECQGAEEE